MRLGVCIRPHLGLCGLRTAPGCPSQPWSYWPAWTAAWTRRRRWSSAGRSEPRRTCSRTGRLRWTWPEWSRWLQDKRVPVSGWRWSGLNSGLILPRRLPKDGTIATHYRPGLPEPFSFLFGYITRWPPFQTLSPPQSYFIFINSYLGWILAQLHTRRHNSGSIIPLIFNYEVSYLQYTRAPSPFLHNNPLNLTQKSPNKCLRATGRSFIFDVLS